MADILFKHVTVVGVGLIGGSFAMAVRRAGLAQRITGWGGKRSLEIALERGIIDALEDSFDRKTRSDADLIYLAAPVSGIIDFLQSRSKCLKPGAVLTDAGSSKVEICRAARDALPSEVEFVGGHPMAGSHRTGVEYATADLFEGAPYALTHANDPEKSSPGLERMRVLVGAIGATAVLLTPAEHDIAVARVSQAPQLVSTAIANAIARSGSEDLTGELAGTGLADMLRLAESNWSVWEDICRTNAHNIADALGEVGREVAALREALEAGRFDALSAAFESGNVVSTTVRRRKR
ncbi:MAG TPA: prephenate dehydrogenase/arogenate dehydrogenase family protein [Blastocatellia bacterium]|nr:prephenate dehydrogenase/arogenate dehydrogenase family protein [Blastocatellia bacterium]